MLSAVAIIPSAPVLVPELAGAAAAEVAELVTAVVGAASVLPIRWIAVGTGPADDVIDAPSTGTFAGFGADVRVGLSAQRSDEIPDELPLCALVAAWVRGRAQPDARMQVRVVAANLDPGTALIRGRHLRAEIDAESDPIGVLIVADGVHTLTPGAPGGYHPDNAGAQRILDDALAGGDVGALTRLAAPVLGRVAFQVLGGVAEAGPRSAQELYRGAPYGVGYFAGVWQP